jgi:hypothetical protein
MATLKGGDKLEAALAKIAKNLTKAAAVDVGFLEDATYPDGTSVAMVAAIQEFGAPKANIPPRPFFRGMIQDKSPEWPVLIAKELKATDYDAKVTLARIGDYMVGELQEAINDFSGAPLSPKTVKKKGSSKQLVDTKVMLRSANRRVKT